VIVQKLVALKVEVDTAHTQALAPDSLVEACRTALGTLGTGTERVPTITWPKWSSAQSKSAKGAWTGDPFACSEIGDRRAGLGVGITTGSRALTCEDLNSVSVSTHRVELALVS
jgi:hypothetical protein